MKNWSSTINLFLSTLAVLSLAACSQISVKQDYDSSTDFKEVTQLSWLPLEKQVTPSAQEFSIREPLIAKRIEAAIDREITAKGLGFNSISPNAFITYHVTTQTKIRSTAASSSVGFGFGGAGRFGGLAFSNAPDIQEYEEGKLVIDIVNLDGKLIWRGISTSILNEQSTPEKTTTFVNEVVTKLLEQFPPK